VTEIAIMIIIEGLHCSSLG